MGSVNRNIDLMHHLTVGRELSQKKVVRQRTLWNDIFPAPFTPTQVTNSTILNCISLTIQFTTIPPLALPPPVLYVRDSLVGFGTVLAPAAIKGFELNAGDSISFEVEPELFDRGVYIDPREWWVWLVPGGAAAILPVHIAYGVILP